MTDSDASNNPSFSHRLAFLLAKRIIVVCFVSWALLSLVLLFSDFSRIDHDVQQRVDEIVNAHRGVAELAVYDFDYQQAKRLSSDLLIYDIVDKVEIINGNELMAIAEVAERGKTETPLFMAQGKSVHQITLRAPEKGGGPAEVGLLRLTISNAKPMREFYRRAMWALLSGLLLNCLVIVAIIWAVHRSLTRPLLQFTRTLRQVDPSSPQKFSVNLPAAIMQTELGDAVHATERLLDAMQSAINNLGMVEMALNFANEKLEEKVRERTESLANANQELTQTYSRLSETQQKLHETDKLAAVGRLAAGVAHEINNPIAIVKGNLSALRTYIRDIIDVLKKYNDAAVAADQAEALKLAQKMEMELGMDFVIEDIRNMLRDMEDSVMRVNDIIKDLKAYSRVDAPDIDRISLDTCVQQVVAITSQIEQTPINWLLHLGETPAIECYPAQINELLMQIVRNAVMALGTSGGQITISTTVVGDHVQLCVSDTGEGISKENMQRVFEPFFTTRPVGQGRGLGLTRARAIVEGHGGDISLQSVEGEGCTVTVRIPLQTSLNVSASTSDAA